MVAGWVSLHERFGRLPCDLLAPAIDVAERVTPCR
jgi:gamma-glutamyltranspeptidase/glutathione hydrolase